MRRSQSPGAVDWTVIAHMGFSLCCPPPPPASFFFFTLLQYVCTSCQSLWPSPISTAPPAQHHHGAGPFPPRMCMSPRCFPGIMTLLHACLSHFFFFSSCSLHAAKMRLHCMQAAAGAGQKNGSPWQVGHPHPGPLPLLSSMRWLVPKKSLSDQQGSFVPVGCLWISWQCSPLESLPSHRRLGAAGEWGPE